MLLILRIRNKGLSVIDPRHEEPLITRFFFSSLSLDHGRSQQMLPVTELGDLLQTGETRLCFLLPFLQTETAA